MKPKQNNSDQGITVTMIIAMIISIIIVATHPQIKFGMGILIIIGSMFLGGWIAAVLFKSDD